MSNFEQGFFGSNENNPERQSPETRLSEAFKDSLNKAQVDIAERGLTEVEIPESNGLVLRKNYQGEQPAIHRYKDGEIVYSVHEI